MDKYEQISIVGEGSYGTVLKCRHKETDQLVAIKKFLETEDDQAIRKMALREIRLLKKLKHENLVTLIEVFRYRKRLYLVFEFLDGTILDELENHPNGLDDEICRDRIYQILRAVHYCHNNQIIHRDVKPENVLVSSLGVVKLCDFGFARYITLTGDQQCTDYVATRWYRAPELLCGETNYGGGVDIWAIGCLFSEIITGEPLFAGDSDIDQLYLIVKMLGKPCERHQQLMLKNSNLRGIIINNELNNETVLMKHFENWSIYAIEFVMNCLKMDPNERPTADELLKSNYFQHDRFPQRFLPQLRKKVNIEFNNNPLLRKYKSEILITTDKRDDPIANKMKKLQQNHEQLQQRWRFILTPEENCIKHKHEMTNDNLITLSKTSQQLNILQQKLVNTTTNKQSVKFNSINNSNISNDNQHKIEDCTILPPAQFHLNFKKSPNLLQSIGSFARTVPQQQSSMIVKNFVRKLDRCDHYFDTNFDNQPQKKKELKNKNDVFTLPNLPGVVTGSPIKNIYNHNIKKKSLPELDVATNSTTVTPRIQSSTSSTQNHSPTKTYC